MVNTKTHGQIFIFLHVHTYTYMHMCTYNMNIYLHTYIQYAHIMGTGVYQKGDNIRGASIFAKCVNGSAFVKKYAPIFR